MVSQIKISPNIILQDDFQQDWQLLETSDLASTFMTHSGQIEHYINAKGLACPMPLLKLKMALKNTTIANCVYITATDPNSQRDIGAFCQHAGYDLSIAKSDNDDCLATDTIFHLLITKNC